MDFIGDIFVDASGDVSPKKILAPMAELIHTVRTGNLQSIASMW